MWDCSDAWGIVLGVDSGPFESDVLTLDELDVAGVAEDDSVAVKLAAEMGSFGRTAAARSDIGHRPVLHGSLLQHPRNGGLVFSQV
jgi:hypothetical protein